VNLDLPSLESLERIAMSCPEPFGDSLLAGLAELRREIVARLAQAEDVNRTNAEAAYRATMMKAELEEALDQARQAHARARTSARAKSEFLRNVTHEIRTPMTAILGYADLLLDPMTSSSDRHSYVQVIRRNGEQLVEMIGDILEFSKLESGSNELELARCSPAEILAGIVQDVRTKAIEKNLSLVLRYEGLVPVSIETDPNRLRLLLQKVVRNAIKFTEQGGVAIEVRLADDETVDLPQLVIRVSDTGIGIPRDALDDIFVPFVQGDGTNTRRHGGAGLGLALARRIVHLLGGSIHVESEPGRGSTFTLTVETGDLQGVALVEQSGVAQLGSLPLARTAVDHAREAFAEVLLAEDGTDNQKLIALLLKKAGLEVTIAFNGAAALERVQQAMRRRHPYRLILMDMQMPEMDGYTATTRLRSEGYRGPIVALTAAAMSGDRERCLEAGCDDYLTKPIDRVRLLSLVESYLRPDLPDGGLPLPGWRAEVQAGANPN